MRRQFLLLAVAGAAMATAALLLPYTNSDAVPQMLLISHMPCQPSATGSSNFTYTGANQTFVVPACVKSITVKAWGAGGCGMKTIYIAGKGGGGGYATGSLPVSPGESLNIIVGGGGIAGPVGPGTTAGGFGGGGASSMGDTGWGRCSGGGRSAVQRSNADIISAGGGGGSGGYGDGYGSSSNDGGGGGGITGNSSTGAQIAGGGTQSAGGSGGGGGAPGTLYTGGNSSSYGGGGGGGYYGGGGNGSTTSNVGAGGGGSSYVPTGGSTIAAVGSVAGNASDYAYPGGGVGTGGTGSSTGASGGNGYLTISWNTALPLSDPSTVSSLALWFDTTTLGKLYQDSVQTTSVATSSDPVGAWLDKVSGLSVVQSTSASRPTYITNAINGLPVIRFNGSSSYLQSTANTTVNAPNTIFVVAKDSGTTAEYGIGGVFSHGGTSTPGPGLMSNGSVYWLDGSGGGPAGSANTTSAISTFRVITAVYTQNFSGGSYMYTNGMQEGYYSGGGYSIFPGSGLVQIGGRTWGGWMNRLFKGDIGEVLVYNRQLTSTEINTVVAWLRAKWGF